MSFDKRIEEILEIATAVKPNINEMTKEELLKGEKLLKGTTVVGVRYKDGIILGSDKQATFGDSRGGDVQKIFIVDKFTVMGVAGTYAICQWRVNLFKQELKSWEIELKTKISMEGRTKILSRHLLTQPHSPMDMMIPLLGLGEYNGSDFSLVKYDGMGAYMPVDFVVIGSGEPDAGPVLRQYNEKTSLIKELNFEPAKDLVLEALGRAAKDNIGTGPKFDLVILDKNGARFLEAGGER